MTRLTRILAPLLALALLAGCSSVTKQNPREEALYAYASAIRWSEFTPAASFVDPAVLAIEPLTELEIERYKQFKVSGYTVKSSNMPSEDAYLQTVEIRVVNIHTQVERVITDHQNWRWDEEAGRWWLVSGLPDLDVD